MENPIVENVLPKGWETELKKLEKVLIGLAEQAEKINISISKKGANGKSGAEGKQLAEVLKQYQETLKKVADLERQMIELKKKKTTETVKLTREEKLQVQINNSLKGSYNQMQAQLSLNLIKLKALSDEERNNVQIGGRLTAQNLKLNQSLQAIDKGMAMNQRRVGDYGSAFERFGGTIKTLALGAFAAGMALVSRSLAGTSEVALDAEKSMQRLAFSIRNVGGGNAKDIEKIVGTAERLMGVFDDEIIKDAAVSMLNFGLSVKQVNQLLPLMVDAAAASGKPLSEIALAIDKGVDSGVMARSALGQLGLSFKDTGSKAENYAKIIEGLTKFEGGNTEALKTQWGQMENMKTQWGEIKEQLGGMLLTVIMPLANGIVHLGDVWLSTQEKMARSANRISNSRLEDFKKEIVGQSDKVKLIDDEIKAERSVYTQKQKAIKLLEEEKRLNDAKGFFMHSTQRDSEIKKEVAGLKTAVNQSIIYVNTLAGLRQELKEGAGAINTFSDEEEKAEKTTKKTEVSLTRVRMSLSELSAEAKKMQIDLGGNGFDIMPEEKVEGLKDRLDKATKLINAFNDETIKNAKDLADEQESIENEKDALKWDLARQSVDLIAELGDSLIERQLDKLDEQNDAYKQSYDDRIKQIEGLGLSEEETTKEKAAAEAYYQSQLEQTKAREKELQREQFILNQLAALAQVAINTAINITSPLNIAGALTPYYIAIGAAQAAIIAAQTIPQFAEGGQVLPEGRITASPNIPTRSSGDNILAYVRHGETILNNDQMLALGGAYAMKMAGVPGYEDARYQPDMSDIRTGYTGKNGNIIVNANFESEKIVRKLDELIKVSSKSDSPKLMDTLKSYRHGNR